MTIRRLFSTLLLIALFAMGVRETLDPDMWWHLRTGEAILRAGIPRHDIFSFTVPHYAWVTHEWLSQLFMWDVYLLGGLPGLMVVFALLTALIYGLVFASSPGRPYLTAFITLLAAFASAIVWGARPQMFNLLLTSVFVFIVERLKDGKVPARALWLLPFLTILWANLHSGYLLGIVLLAAYTAGEALQRWRGLPLSRTLPWPEIRLLALVTLLSFMLASINPNGARLWIYPFETLGSPAMQAYIQEWQPPDFRAAPFWPFAAMLALGLGSWVYGQQRPTWSERLLFLGTAAAGLLSARHIPLFAIVAAPIISRHLVHGLAGTQPGSWLMPPGPAERPARAMTALNLAILVLAAAGAGLWTAAKIAGNDAAIAQRYPVAAVDFLERAGLAEARIYNSYNWGGYLIWRGIPVFVDGRADVYGDPFLFDYLQTFEVTDNWREPLQKYDVTHVLMEQDSPLTTLLAADKEWRELYVDDQAQIFARVSQ
ncbi:MAG: hypothetical protein ACE5E7_12115 [Anaerolineae bacterium]